MNRFTLSGIALLVCLVSRLNDAAGQAAVPDTVYVYETVTVFDTVRISDTVRIRKAIDPAMNPGGDSSVFFTPPAATIPETGIILHENNKQKNVKVMKFNVTSYLGAFILTAQSMAGLSAQETSTATDDLQKFPVQMSIVYPMTTQGDKTVNYRYNFSFNLFTGNTGAVTGVEFGSFLNKVEREIKGVQVSGLFNLTRKASGVQFAGLGNASKATNGIQFGGLGNVAGDAACAQRIFSVSLSVSVEFSMALEL
jgi:hypothetical protein